jgi:lysozyme family protein
MTSATWPKALAFVMLPQNDGQSYHVTDHDTGRGTAWGITEDTWYHAVDTGLVHGDIHNATQAQAGVILRQEYWNGTLCDGLPLAVDFLVFNMAMMAGQGRAIKLLQRIVGVLEDGVNGPKTIAATARQDTTYMLMALTKADEQFFQALSGATYFINGWTNRAEYCKHVAQSLLIAPIATIGAAIHV